MSADPVSCIAARQAPDPGPRSPTTIRPEVTQYTFSPADRFKHGPVMLGENLGRAIIAWTSLAELMWGLVRNRRLASRRILYLDFACKTNVARFLGVTGGVKDGGPVPSFASCLLQSFWVHPPSMSAATETPLGGSETPTASSANDSQLTEGVKQCLDNWRQEWEGLATGTSLVIRKKNLDMLTFAIATALVTTHPELDGGPTGFEEAEKLTWAYFDPDGKACEGTPLEHKEMAKLKGSIWEQYTGYNAFRNAHKEDIVRYLPQAWERYKTTKAAKGDTLTEGDLRPCPTEASDSRWVGHHSRARAYMWLDLTEAERQQWNKQAEDWNLYGAPKNIQDAERNRIAKLFMNRTYLYALRNLGMELVMFGLFESNGKTRVLHFEGDPDMFHRRYPEYCTTKYHTAEAGDRTFMKTLCVHADQRFLRTGQLEPPKRAEALPKKKKLLATRDDGYPRIPANHADLNNQDTITLVRNFVNMVYTLDTGIKKSVSWKHTMSDPTKFIVHKDLPVALEDPSDMKTGDIKAIIKDWYEIQECDAIVADPLHFPSSVSLGASTDVIDLPPLVPASDTAQPRTRRRYNRKTGALRTTATPSSSSTSPSVGTLSPATTPATPVLGDVELSTASSAVPTITSTTTSSTVPTTTPSAVPTTTPSAVPTIMSTTTSSAVPTTTPSAVPTAVPSAVPTMTSTTTSSAAPIAASSAVPTAVPSAVPTTTPSA
ncbi:hypothetical protein CONPUDRAFT_77578, partial [Coniophora puteana RWD-64-598 SS2]